MSDSVTEPTPSPTIPPELSHEMVGLGSLLFVIIILFTLLSEKAISKYHLHFLSESTVSIVLGLIIGVILRLVSSSSHGSPNSPSTHFSFDPEFFFFVLLPPIVFEAGFSLKRKQFFLNMTPILVFAVLGTMISTLLIAFGLYLLSFVGALPLFNAGNPCECLLFGALISAVDPVGTLSVLGKKELGVDPMLYSLVFGESVLNDAVSIVLFKIFRAYNRNSVALSFKHDFLAVIGEFCVCFLCSSLIGLACALTASMMMRVLHKSDGRDSALTGSHASRDDHELEMTNTQNKSCIAQSSKSAKSAKSLDAALSRGGINMDAKQNSKSEHEANVLQSPEAMLSLDAQLHPQPTQLSMMGSRSRRSRSVGFSDTSRSAVMGKDVIYLDEYRHNENAGILGESPSLEFSIVILFSYLSYNLGEVLSASGIVAVFSCGICQSHYAWYSLTWVGQVSLHHIIRALSKCCENFVYAYLGISIVHTGYRWSPLLIVFTLALCLLARAANIFPLSALVNLRRTKQISFQMQIMLCFSSLRGAIAFALALNINTPHADLIITTTLSVVLVTTFVCGSTAKMMLDRLGLSKGDGDEASDGDETYLMLNNRESTRTWARQGFGKHWDKFDRTYMQRWFGGAHNPCVQYSNIGIYSNRKQTVR